MFLLNHGSELLQNLIKKFQSILNLQIKCRMNFYEMECTLGEILSLTICIWILQLILDSLYLDIVPTPFHQVPTLYRGNKNNR